MCYRFIVCFCFFKHQTAYDVRISDWSSDVCSSDLLDQHRADGYRVIAVERRVVGPEEMRAEQQREHQRAEQACPTLFEAKDEKFEEPAARPGRERKSVV